MSDFTDLLPWLPSPPPHYRTIVRALSAGSSIDESTLRRLAAHSLDLTQLGRLSSVISERYKEIANTSRFLPLRIGLIGSHTLDYIADSLPATGLRHGLLLSVTRTPYGQVAQAVLDQHSGIAAGTLDVVLLALDARALDLFKPRFSAEEAVEAVEAAISQLILLRDGVRSRIGAVCAFQTLPLPVEPLFGSFDARFSGSPRAMADAFNRRLAEVVSDGDLIIDIAYAASSAGLTRWHDPRSWHTAKLPFSLEITPFYAEHVCRVLGAAYGKARKCLVLDLDNTLWGGVIGDDGLDGIVLGQGNGPGEAFTAVQEFAFYLRERGVILAICSKNEETTALIPFGNHNEMVLSRDHIACFIANWNDKATNLRSIAATLNIGTDALVFLDDNPAERALVRQELPDVAVPEVGIDPADYPSVVARAGYFEAVSFSNEDRERAKYYQANAERQNNQESITNLADYLTSLQMTMNVKPFDATGRTRITQLINKSNQFNLTTRRYTEAQIEAVEHDPSKFALQVRVKDRFGDNGMISVVIFDKQGAVWGCDAWLMSCRVLGRQIEEAVLLEVATAARAAGANALCGRYIPTKRNAIVAEHFSKLGFKLTAANNDGSTEWRLDLAEYQLPSLPILVERNT